ncbi:MAG: tetratricopeptide repeat protein [Methylophilaceae bacterium]|nr:tetratricopeptide repeat protein [Methylophilaceae bacterium]
MPLFRALPHALLVVASLFVFGIAQADDLKEIAQLANQGQQAAALERIDTYIAANPKDIQAQFIKGVILAEQNRRDEAIKIFADITSKNPNLPEPHNNLAVLYAEQGEYDKARKALENAIKTHPSYATAHENLGDIYARMASEAYDKALQLDSGNTRAQNKLALIRDLFSSAKKPVMSASRPTSKATGTVKPADVKSAGTPTPSAATKPAPTPATKPAPVGADATTDITSAVEKWAKAWSDQDVDAYLASYSSSFKTPKGESRSAWENLRRDRISAPKSIKVELSDIKVTMESNTQARVTFRQNYRASHLSQRTGKTLVMINVNGQWLIEQEIAQR